MSLLTIGGVPMATPSSIQVSIMDISRAERNANGNMTIERINTKKKLAISYDFIDSFALEKLLGVIKNTYFDVTFIDPVTNNFVTKSMYCGDRNMGVLDYWTDYIRYKDVSFDLIER